MQNTSGYGSIRRMLDEVVDVELATSGQQYQQQQHRPQAAAPSQVVKQERHDDHEINELAAKIVESNKAHLAKQQQQALQQQNLLRQQQLAGGTVPAATNGSGNILNYFGRKTTAAAATATTGGGGGAAVGTTNGGGGAMANSGSAMAASSGAASPGGTAAGAADEKKPPCDEESQMGHFGWHTCNKTIIPYIVRSGEKYCAVRIVETKLLNKYLSYLHQDIYNCTCVRSYYITEAESRLLNEINQKHCDMQFGRELFTHKDLVVRLSDVNKFYTFLDVCYRKLLMGNSGAHSEKCGFIRINKESVVPYTVRDNQKYVPLFYFEGETENLKLKADYLSGWDLSYLKFCCKVQGIRNELFASDQVAVISLTDIKSYFPPGIEFEDYWPSKVVDSQLLITKNGTGPGGAAGLGNSGGVNWTRQPSAPPPKPSGGGAAIATVGNTKVIPSQGMTQQAMIAAAQLQNMQQQQQQQQQSTAHANSAAANSRAKQQAQGMTANGGVNNMVYNGNRAAGMAANTQLSAAAASNSRLVSNVWSNLTPQEQYQLQLAESRAYAGAPTFNYNMMRAMQSNNGSASGGASQGPPPPLVRGSGTNAGQGGGQGNRSGSNASHMSSGQTGASPSPALSLLFPSPSSSVHSSSATASTLLSPPPTAKPGGMPFNAAAAAAALFQQYAAAGGGNQNSTALLAQSLSASMGHSYQQQQQQQNDATISYLHSSLSLTPTSPQTPSTASTPAPSEPMLFIGSPELQVTKTNRASVVVQPSQKVIPPPPSLIPMAAAGSLLGVGGGGHKDLQKIQESLQQLQNLKYLTTTFVSGGGNGGGGQRTAGNTNNNNRAANNNSRATQNTNNNSNSNRMSAGDPSGYGHYKNNPQLATIRPAATSAPKAYYNRINKGGGGGSASGGGGGYSVEFSAGGNNNQRNSNHSQANSNQNINSSQNNNHYLNQQILLSQQRSADVIDLSPTPQRSSAAAVAAAFQQQQFLQQQYFQQQQQQVQQQQQQQQRGSMRNGGGGGGNGGAGAAMNMGNADLANCLSLLAAGGGNATASMGRSRNGVDELAAAAAAANMMNKAVALQNAPYKIQRQFVDGVEVTCINMKAYNHTELLMRVQELCDKFFPQTTHENCRRVLEVFNVVIYSGNSQQIKLFAQHLQQRASDYMELVLVKDVTNYMPQLKYIIKSQLQEPLAQSQQQHHSAPPNKRTRIS